MAIAIHASGRLPIFAVVSKDGLRKLFAADSPAQGMAPRVPGGFPRPQLATLLQQLQWLTIAGKPENDRLKIVVEGESLDDSNARQLADLLNGVVLLARAGWVAPESTRPPANRT